MMSQRRQHKADIIPAEPARLYWRRDLLTALAISVAAWFGAGALELQERIHAWTRHYEHLQLDEAPVVLIAMLVAMSWFGWRRLRETARLAAERSGLMRRLIDLQENERRSIARDLHDTLGQDVTAIALEARRLKRHLDEPGEVLAAAERIADSSERIHSLSRNLLRTLNVDDIDACGLNAALQGLCEQWEEQHRVACVLHGHPSIDALPRPLAVAAYRVVQEGLTNAARHAHASQVRVRLAPDEPQRALLITVEDNGASSAAAAPSAGLGLRGLAERAALLGGEIHFQTLPEGGARLSAALPLSSLPPLSHA